MSLAEPQWLILVPLVVYAAFRWRGLRLESPLRLACAALLAAALCDPRLGSGERALDVWVLADRSSSAASLGAEKFAEWRQILERSKPPSDGLYIVDFADVAGLRGEADAAHFDGAPEESRLALAIRFALARAKPGRDARLLMLGDGYSTEPLSGLGEILARKGAALDFRLAETEDVVDYRIEGLRMPHAVQPGEPFVMELDVRGSADAKVPYRITRDGAQIAEGKLDVIRGRAYARFTDRFTESGSHRYAASISPARDAHSGNDTAAAWIDVRGERHVLVVSGYADDPMARALSGGGFSVKLATDPGRLRPEDLSAASAVILNGVHASRIPRDFLEALKFFVTSQGGGFSMFGGRSSFGSGGYFASPIEDILPVSMELREDHRKVAVAMALVLDRSGSMAAGVGGGMGGMTKMDLANEGAARTAELLGPKDLLTVFAVDSEPHRVVALTAAHENAVEIASTVRSITSGGGGIFVFNGLQAGWKEMEASKLQRHMVLFADAADAEQPGEYKELLEKIIRQKASVSVIGLGSESDPDADFLKDVAARGGGRAFFVENAMDLPAVFAQEAVSVARSTFVEEPTGISGAPGWSQIASGDLVWPAAVDGYNLSYLKPRAGAAALSTDSESAPLVSFWQRGAGRSAAVLFPVAGPQSERIRKWPAYGDFLQTLIRWLAGTESPRGLSVVTDTNGNTLELDLFYDEGWSEEIASREPRLAVSTGASGEAIEPKWSKLSPGHFQAKIELPAGEVLRGAVQVGGTALRFGPVSSPYNPEWAFPEERLDELRALSRASGGEERLDLGSIWQAERASAALRLQPYLLAAFLAAFLLDALLTRLNYALSLPTLSWPRSIPRIRWRRRARVETTVPRVKEFEEPASGDNGKGAEGASDEELATKKMRRRFSSAKRRDGR